MFTSMALARFRSGAETGNVRASARQMADYYENETSLKLKAVVEMIQTIVALIITARHHGADHSFFGTGFGSAICSRFHVGRPRLIPAGGSQQPFHPIHGQTQIRHIAVLWTLAIR